MDVLEASVVIKNSNEKPGSFNAGADVRAALTSQKARSCYWAHLQGVSPFSKSLEATILRANPFMNRR